MTIDDLRSAQKTGGDTRALRLLADAGRLFDSNVAPDLRRDIAGISEKSTLFRRCIAVAAEWAGFVERSPDWRNDAVRYLLYGTPAVSLKYRRGFHGKADPMAYLDTWTRLLNDAGT
jgi:hypothetical protein